jgi:hypothetical protein
LNLRTQYVGGIALRDPARADKFVLTRLAPYVRALPASLASIVILNPNNIVLAETAPGLHLDQFQQDFAGKF